MRAGEREDLLHHVGQPARFVADQPPVLLRVLRVLHHAVGQVVGSHANHRERGAQLMRDAHGELHLQLGQYAGALGGKSEHGDAQRQHQQYAEADGHGT